MRQEYYTLLADLRIRDMMSNIQEISYSKKIKMIKDLLLKYSIDDINMAFNEYELNYIRLNRVDLIRLENTLKNICERVKNKHG